MPVNPVSQLIVVRHAYSIPSVSRASISVSGIRCPDDLRERTYGTASGISDEHHLEPCRYAPNGHAMLTIPAHRGAMRRDDRAAAISGLGRRHGRCEAMCTELDDAATGVDMRERAIGGQEHGKLGRRRRQTENRHGCGRESARKSGREAARREDVWQER